MIALAHELSLSLIFFTLFILFLVYKWLSPSKKNVPPSPRKLPIIGNLHQLGTLPHRSLRALSNIYGPLILLHFGRVPVLVASSAEAAKEIMKNQDSVFASRPKLSILSKLNYGSRNVAMAAYGEYWRRVRSITVLHLLSNKKVGSYGRVREEEMLAMIEKIQLSSSSGVVDMHDVLFSLTNNILCRVAFGRKYGENQNFKKLIRDLNEVGGATSLRDYFPWLGIIDRVNGLDARVESVAKQFDAFLENVIQEHKDIGRKRNDDEMDFVDILLDFQRENIESVEDDTIKAMILDMFVAGTDTSSTTLEWGLSELIKKPSTMRILETEVRSQILDVEKMPYLKAVVKETLRLHPPIPLLLPRESMEDTRVMGYEISAGTQVLINAWAIGRDPSSWDEPEEFRPERFLESSVDFKGVHFELIPFGAGRRGCPGIAFGLAVVEPALAKLVQSFNFELPNNGSEDLDMSESIGIAVGKKLPLLVTVTPATSY